MPLNGLVLYFFLMLGIYYPFSIKQNAKDHSKGLKKGRLILSGISISALNFMVFPYWIFYFTYLKKQAILSFEYPMQLSLHWCWFWYFSFVVALRCSGKETDATIQFSRSLHQQGYRNYIYWPSRFDLFQI